MSQVETPAEKPAETTTPAAGAEGTKPTEGAKPDGQQPPNPAAAVDGKAGNEGESKPEGQKPAETPAGESKAPDTYSLTAPEGMDADELKTFETFARERNLTNEQAQAALDTLPDALASQVSRFRADAEKHPEIGGDKLQASVQLGMKVLDKFLPATEAEGAALRRGLNVSGYGNYAPLVLLLARIGKAMGEDGGPGHQTGSASGTPAAEKSLEERIYGKP